MGNVGNPLCLDFRKFYLCLKQWYYSMSFPFNKVILGPGIVIESQLTKKGFFVTVEHWRETKITVF